MDKKKIRMDQNLRDLTDGYIATEVKNLLTPAGQFTTLELKNALRKSHPAIMWNQNYISGSVIRLQSTLGLKYSDNGSYRTYSHASIAAASKKRRKAGKAKAAAKGKLTVGLTYKVEIDTVGWKTITPYKFVDGRYRCKVSGEKYRRYSDAQILNFKLVR